MPIEKGQPWGRPGPLPPEGVVARSDAQARAVLERARAEGRPVPTIGLAGGDLCRTMGGTGDVARLRSPAAMTFPVDVGRVLVDGSVHYFVAHLVARNRRWTRVFVAMNAQWWRGLDLGPRAHPGDGLLDTYDGRLSFPDLAKVRARARTGSHLPHPGIRERRSSALEVELGRPRGIFCDGQEVGRSRSLSVQVEPDALTVVV